MKINLLLVSLACAIGIMVGSWEPRAKIRALERQVKERPAANNAPLGGLQAITRLANIPDSAQRPRARRRNRMRPNPVPNAPTPNATQHVEVAEAAAVAATNSPPLPMQRRLPRIPRKELAENMDQVRDLWLTRAELVRSQWKEKLKLDEEKSALLDSHVEEMNNRLAEVIKTSAEIIEQQKKISQELTVSLGGSMMTVVAETYEKIGECVPAERRDEISDLPVIELIDPAIAEPLLQVEGFAENPAPAGGN